MTLLVAYIAASVALLYAAFCRLVHIDKRTRVEVRFAFVLLAFAASACIVSATAWEYHPGWPDVLINASFALVLIVSSRLWKFGVPSSFQKRS